MTNEYYSDTVWGGLSIGCGKNLQRLQNRAAHIVQGRSTTEEAFQMLGWINLETQRIMHKCILVYKCLNNLAAPYFCDDFIRNNCIHSHDTRNRNDLQLPRTLKGATSLSNFKNLLKQYITR